MPMIGRSYTTALANSMRAGLTAAFAKVYAAQKWSVENPHILMGHRLWKTVIKDMDRDDRVGFKMPDIYNMDRLKELPVAKIYIVMGYCSESDQDIVTNNYYTHTKEWSVCTYPTEEMAKAHVEAVQGWRNMIVGANIEQDSRCPFDESVRSGQVNRPKVKYDWFYDVAEMRTCLPGREE